MDRSEHLALYGTEVPEAPLLPLRAGRLSMARQGLILRDLRVDGHLAWTSLGFVWRDVHWGTLEPVIDQVDEKITAEGFTLHLQAHLSGPSHVALEVRIEGDATGELRYEAWVRPTAAVETQRAGLCLEHPMALAGQAVQVRHIDDRETVSRFPQEVPAWPPFTAVRAISHAAAPGVWGTCLLEGESFETEDQRNNADASFKTYSRPNAMPRPDRLDGEVLWQRATLRLQPAPGVGEAAHRLALAPDTERQRDLPEEATATRPGRTDWQPPPVFALGLAPEDLALQAHWQPLLRRLRPPRLHLVMDHAGEPLDTQALAGALEASGARLRLDLRAIQPSGPAMPAQEAQEALATLTTLAHRLAAAGITPESVCLFPGQARQQEAVARAFPKSQRGAGTPYFFAQANRAERLGPAQFLSFTTCSLVHGTEAAGVMDGLRSLPSLLQTLRTRHGMDAVEVGPSGLAAPRSPLGAQPPLHRERPLTLARSDPRSGALFGAAWLVGHVAGLIAGGALAISLRGLGLEDGLLLPDPEGWRRSPASFALEALLAPATRMRGQVWAGGPWARVDSEGEAGPCMLVAHLGAQRRLLGEVMGDVISDEISDVISGKGGDRRGEGLLAGDRPVRLQVLDAASWQAYCAGAPSPWRESAEGARTPLGPYALARAFA